MSEQQHASPAEAATKIRALLQESNDQRSDIARLDELRRILAVFRDDRIINSSGGGKTKNASLAMRKWQSFLQKSHAKLIDQLAVRVSHVSFVRIFLGVIATSPVLQGPRLDLMIDPDLLSKLFTALVVQTFDSKPIRTLLLSEFMAPYRDVQYYGMVAIASIAASTDFDVEAADGLVELLKMIPLVESQKELDVSMSTSNLGCLFAPPQGSTGETLTDEDSSSEDEEDDNDERKVKKSKEKPQRLARCLDYRAHRSVWTKAWVAVLKLKHSKATLRDVLAFLPLSVLPVSTQPLRFSDFFMKAYATDAPILSLLALDGLFVLITIHGLEYPAFYKQLYKLVNSPFLYLKQRTQFCRLLDKCLNRNEMLPAHIVAAFSKRLLRKCLTAPPASCMCVVAIVANLLRNHPETACLIHRQEEKKIEDTFDPLTNDPELANALGSSLWEVEALEHHYYPAVVTLAKSVGRDMDAPMHNIEDFLGVTYNSLIEEERGKRKRKETALAFQRPNRLFSKDDLFGSIISRPDTSLEQES